MIARLKARDSVPYGGIFILDLPEKGMVGRGTTFKMLCRSIKEWRHANAVPIGLEYESEVEREICLKYNVECESIDPRMPSSQIRLTLDDIMNGTRMLARFKLAGSPLVDQVEAERRAEICANCPFQSDFSKPCGGICQVLKDLVKSLIGTRTLPQQGRLRACRVCKCYNEAAVFVPLEFQTDYLSSEQKAQFELARQTSNCWKG